jgi:hypothetical protein
MQRADIQGMQHHLNEISANIAPGAHAVLVLDQAGWRTAAKLDKPDNISLLSLPPRSLELNPAEASGNVAVADGSQTTSSTTTTPSATPGTPSSPNHPAFNPSDHDHGRSAVKPKGGWCKAQPDQ